MLEDGMSFVRYAETEKEALLKAALLLEAEGWCQHSSNGEDGERCLSQAIIAASGIFAGASQGARVWSGVADLLAREIGVAGSAGLVHWNDEPGRTRGEVVSLLRRVASRL